ncbi:hypothetical protein FACS189451_13060 [Bacteroidia bacterium]|nr:hypothetical protein FACS189451_13060 [Bacteroidia bacterium]
MREKMKKMLFLMLFLLILGAANVNSQVRIGGNGQPNGAAVLDLNATDAINNGTKTLALPRVSLASTTDKLGSTTLLNGMLVYNTNITSGAGVYYWATDQWVKVSDGSFTEVDGVIGNEITDTIANGGLTKSGAGTAQSPYKVGVKAGGIRDGMIAVGDINTNKILTTKPDSGKFLFSDGSTAFFKYLQSPPIAHPDTFALWSRTPVTWQSVLDTALTLSPPPGAFLRIVAPGLRKGDICSIAGNSPLAQLYHNAALMYITSAEPWIPRPSSYLIRCFRPSI